MHRAILFFVALGCITTQVCGLRVAPTMSSLMFEIGDDEVCLYSEGKDFYEGVSVHYQVIQGNDDFDFSIRSPDGETIFASYAGEHDAEDRVYFTTRSKLQYAYCIDNRMYSKEKKLIKVDVGLTSLKRWKSRIDPLHKLMQRTDGSFLGMHEDQILSRLREQSLRQRLEEIFTLLTIRGATETTAVIIVSLLNVALISHLFRKAL